MTDAEAATGAGRTYLGIILPYLRTRTRPTLAHVPLLDACLIDLAPLLWPWLWVESTAPTDDPPGYTAVALHLAQLDCFRDVPGVDFLRGDPDKKVRFPDCQEDDLIPGAVLADKRSHARWEVSKVDTLITLTPVDQFAGWAMPQTPIQVAEWLPRLHMVAVPERYASLTTVDYYEQVIKQGLSEYHEPGVRRVCLGDEGRRPA